MKVRNIIRIQAAVIGFAATLFLASAAPAQEISNSEWPDGPNVVTPGHAGSGLLANSASTQIAAPAANVSSRTSKPVAAQQTGVRPAGTEGGWLTTLLVMGLAGSVVYALAESRRGKRKLGVREEHLVRGTPLA